MPKAQIWVLCGTWAGRSHGEQRGVRYGCRDVDGGDRDGGGKGAVVDGLGFERRERNAETHGWNGGARRVGWTSRGSDKAGAGRTD